MGCVAAQSWDPHESALTLNPCHSAPCPTPALAGDSGGGHYKTFGRHPLSGVWHTFNDSMVHTCAENDVMRCRAYILFYRSARLPTLAPREV